MPAGSIPSPVDCLRSNVRRVLTPEKTWSHLLLTGKVWHSLLRPELNFTLSSWLNTLYLAMDANFKLKNKERGFHDPPIANGLGYMVSSDALRAHLTECVAKNLTAEVFFCFRILHYFLTLSIPD